MAYGSSNGTAFADFNGTRPWPCGVDIVEIRISAGAMIDSIQVKYKTVDNTIIQGESRGGIGGNERVIRLQDGERITGVAGVVCTKAPHGTHVNQLLFFSQRQDGQKLTYGPYGYALTSWMCRIFAVNGKINSIFGRVRNVYGSIVGLGAIGFYYEDESRSSQNVY